MLTVLRLLQTLLRGSWRRLSREELMVAWLIVGVAYLAFGAQLVLALLGIKVGRVVYANDMYRSVRSTPTSSRSTPRPVPTQPAGHRTLRAAVMRFTPVRFRDANRRHLAVPRPMHIPGPQNVARSVGRSLRWRPSTR